MPRCLTGKPEFSGSGSGSSRAEAKGARQKKRGERRMAAAIDIMNVPVKPVALKQGKGNVRQEFHPSPLQVA